MEANASDSQFPINYFSFAEAHSDAKTTLDELAGSRQTRKTLASLEYGLVQERLAVTGLEDECARLEAQVRADLALMAVGLLRYDRQRGLVRTGSFLSSVRNWQVEQARALVQLAPDELCQEVLWRLNTLPSVLVEDVLRHTMRLCPAEPAILPITFCDFWNAGLFSSTDITASRLLECRARAREWGDKRTARDPRVVLAYLRTLHSLLRDRSEAAGIHKFLMRVEEAMTFWKKGYQLGEDFFPLDGSLDSGMRTGLQVIVQHLYEAQSDPDFPWQAEIAQQKKGMMWLYNSTNE